jgi:hypothetical protein
MNQLDIAIDFECEGTQFDSTNYPPTLLGVVIPGQRGGGKSFSYRCYLLEPELKPIYWAKRNMTGTGRRIVATLEEAITKIVEIAEQRQCRIAAFTQFELKKVAAFLAHRPELVARFRSLYRDLRKESKTFINSRRMKTGESELDGFSLDIACERLGIKQKKLTLKEFGVPTACCKLRQAGKRTTKWKRWTSEEHETARELIRYNRVDCLLLLEIMKKLSTTTPSPRAWSDFDPEEN